MGSNTADMVISAIHVYSGIHVYYFVLNITLYMIIQAYMFIRNRRVQGHAIPYSKVEIRDSQTG